MGLFGNRKKQAAATRSDAIRDQQSDAGRQASHPEGMRPAVPLTNLVRPGGGLFGLGGRIIDKLFGVLQDPNGKISSKRAGAGAMVIAGIGFLNEQRTTEGIICLSGAILLFALTKWDPQGEEK